MKKAKKQTPWNCSEEWPNTVIKPVLSFKRPEGGAINLWMLDAKQVAILGAHHNFHFGGDKTASLIYEEKGGFGHQATENNVWDESTWKWVQKWMERGMLAEGHLKPEDSKYWTKLPTTGNDFEDKERAEEIKAAEAVKS